MPREKVEKTFEQQLEELESIISRMESTQVPLEAMLADYEQGTLILQKLTDKLSAAQAKLQKLSGGEIEELHQDDGI